MIPHMVWPPGCAFSGDGGNGRSGIVAQSRGDEPAFLNTAWTVQAVRGVLLAVVCALAAWPVARFYERPELAALLAVAGLSNVFGGLNSTALVTLNRHLALARLTLGNIALRFFQVGVMVVWALVSPSAWALVGGTVVAAVTHASLRKEIAGHLTRAGWRPLDANRSWRPWSAWQLGPPGGPIEIVDDR